MNDTPIPFQRISRGWMFGFLLLCLALSFALEYLILPGRGKAIFYAILMTGFAIRTAQPRLNERPITTYLIIYALLHFFLIFAIPLDAEYPGGILLPLAIVDYVIFYLFYEKIGAPTNE